MPSEMKFLIDKIHESPTTDEMVDYCIRLITKHGNAINIVPKYRDADLWRNYTAFEPGEKYDNIFNITEVWSQIYRDECEWKYKILFLGTSAQCGAGRLSQLDAIDEKMGNRRGIHDIAPGFCSYETFNKMDMLFRLCGRQVKGLNISKCSEVDPKQTCWDNSIIEMRYPDCTPEYRAEVCTRLIQDYGYCLDFVPVYNPNKFVKYGVKVYSNLGGKKQRVFVVCKKNDGGLAIIYSKTNLQYADEYKNSGAIPVIGALLDLCKANAR